VINLSHRAKLVIGSRDMPPCPVTNAAIAGMGGHYGAINRGVFAHDDHRAAVFWIFFQAGLIVLFLGIDKSKSTD